MNKQLHYFMIMLMLAVLTGPAVLGQSASPPSTPASAGQGAAAAPAAAPATPATPAPAPATPAAASAPAAKPAASAAPATPAKSTTPAAAQPERGPWAGDAAEVTGPTQPVDPDKLEVSITFVKADIANVLGFLAWRAGCRLSRMAMSKAR